jgi:hypothetical protein
MSPSATQSPQSPSTHYGAANGSAIAMDLYLQPSSVRRLTLDEYPQREVKTIKSRISTTWRGSKPARDRWWEDGNEDVDNEVDDEDDPTEEIEKQVKHPNNIGCCLRNMKGLPWFYSVG